MNPQDYYNYQSALYQLFQNQDKEKNKIKDNKHLLREDNSKPLIGEVNQLPNYPPKWVLVDENDEDKDLGDFFLDISEAFGETFIGY